MKLQNTKSYEIDRSFLIYGTIEINVLRDRQFHVHDREPVPLP